MRLPELVTLAKDLILSGAAIVGIYVAIKGLGTWQRQLKGQSEYELSRRMYRDAISGLRRPAMGTPELPTPPGWRQKRYGGAI